MLRNLIIAVVILALGVAGNLWLNQDKSTSRRPVAQASDGTPPATPESSAPAGPSNNSAPDSEARPAGEGSPPASDENAPADGGNANSSEQNANQRPQRTGPGGMRGGQFAQQSSTAVEVLRPVSERQHARLTVYGVIEAQTSTTLNATSSATVEAITAVEGGVVSQGQTLVTLSAPTTQEQLAQRRASLAELDARIRSEALKHENDLAALEIEKELVRIAKNAVDRFSSLNTQQLSSSNDYESALRTYQSQLLSLQNRQLTIAQYADTQAQLRAQRDQLQSQIRQSQELVDDLNITAPFNGLLAQLSVTQGQSVNTGELIGQIYDPDSLVLYVRVPVRYRLDLADLTQIRATDSNGRQWQARAIRPMNEAGAQRLTLEPLSDDSVRPLPGSYVSLSLDYPINEPTIAVPTTAVYDQQRVYIFQPQSQSIQAVPVDIVGRTENGYLIRDPALDQPAPIIVTRMKTPVTGMKVSVVRPNRGDRS